MTKPFALLLLALMIGCATSKPPRLANDFLSESLSHPKRIDGADIPSRYWVRGRFLVHFISNVNEQNKNQIPTIYVHGLGGSLDGFSDLIRILHPLKASRPFYALDLPPFGRSVMRTSELSIHDYTDMLNDFIEMLSVPKVNLVCHSMGGQVCIDLALAHPNQIELLTLISPAGTYEKSAFVNDVTNQFVGVSVGAVDYPKARSIGDMSWYYPEFTRRMITNDPLILVGVESFRVNFHDRIQNLKTRTLIIWGREDKIFSFTNGVYLKENIENSTLYVINGAGHTSFETHAATVANLIQKHLSKGTLH